MLSTTCSNDDLEYWVIIMRYNNRKVFDNYVYNISINTDKRSNKVMNTRYEQELQAEILNDEDIKYDNDDVENEYLKHFWD